MTINPEVIEKIEALEKTDYTSVENQTIVKSLLDSLPSADSCTDAAGKVQILSLRSRLKLLSFSAQDEAANKQLLKDAEGDVSKALKLNSKDMSAWLVMSEVLWRKKSFKEALNAVESALRISPNDVKALCQASRLARVVSVHEKSADKKPAMITTSIQRAKQALAVNPSSSEAWLCLGLTLFHEAGTTVMTFAGLRKALSAVSQACRCDPKNADAFLNRGLIEHSLTQFADALVSFETASKIDPSLKAQCDPFFKRSQGMLMLLQQRLRIPLNDRVKIIGEDFKSALKVAQAASLSPPAGSLLTGLQTAFSPVIASVKKSGGNASSGVSASNEAQSAANPTAVTEEEAKKPKACVLGVLRLISSSNEAPLIYECVDLAKNLFCVAVCNLSPKAIDLSNVSKKPVSITVLIPPAEVAVLSQTPSAEPIPTDIQRTLARIDGGLHPLHCIFCDANSILINTQPVSAEHVISATVAAESL